MLQEGQHWATSYALSAQDLYLRFPHKKYISFYKEFTTLELRYYYGRIFKYLIYLVTNDVIENNIIFQFPPGVGAWIEMESYAGEDFSKARQNGAFQDVDFLASNFTGYQLRLRMTNRYGKWTKRLYVSAKYRDRITELTNQGKLLIGGKKKLLTAYTADIQKLFPIFSKVEINHVLSYGLRLYAYVNKQHCDVLLRNLSEEAMTSFCGFLTYDSLKHYRTWHIKWRIKERMLYRLKRTPWDGYYYIGVTTEQHKQLLKQRKIKHLKDVYLVKVKKEFHHQSYVKYIWRLPYIADCGWKFLAPDLKTDKLEFVEKNDYAKYHQCFRSRNDE